MTGMEMMLAKMLGVTPEQMRDTINSAVELLGNLDARLNNIERMIIEMHSVVVPTKGPHVIEGEVIEGTSDVKVA